jgi:hypothetical protein
LSGLNLDPSNSAHFRYSIRSDDKSVVMVVSNGSSETSVPLQWAFGSGIVGQSYVWKQGSDLMETRFNYFGASIPLIGHQADFILLPSRSKWLLAAPFQQQRRGDVCVAMQPQFLQI